MATPIMATRTNQLFEYPGELVPGPVIEAGTKLEALAVVTKEIEGVKHDYLLVSVAGKTYTAWPPHYARAR